MFEGSGFAKDPYGLDCVQALWLTEKTYLVWLSATETLEDRAPAMFGNEVPFWQETIPNPKSNCLKVGMH